MWRRGSGLDVGEGREGGILDLEIRVGKSIQLIGTRKCFVSIERKRETTNKKSKRASRLQTQGAQVTRLINVSPSLQLPRRSCLLFWTAAFHSIATTWPRPIRFKMQRLSCNLLASKTSGSGYINHLDLSID